MATSTALVRPEKSTNVRNVPHALRTLMGFTERWLPAAGAWVADHLFTTPTRFRRPVDEARALDGAERFTLPVRIGDRVVPLAAWRWDEDRLGLQHRPVALLVHGWAGRGSQLHPFVGPLVAAGYAVVSFDFPAHGDSPGRRTNLVEMARALAGVVRHVGAPAVLVTHSLGGGAALLAATADWVDPVARAQLAQAPVAFVAPPMDADAFTRAFVAQLGVGERTLSAFKARFERRVGFGWTDVAYAPAALRFAAPAFVVHDADDMDVPLDAGLAFARGVAAVELMVTAGLGHRRVLRDPEVVERVVGFLRRSARVRAA